jgi:hypothetical protein
MVDAKLQEREWKLTDPLRPSFGTGTLLFLSKVSYKVSLDSRDGQ